MLEYFEFMKERISGLTAALDGASSSEKSLMVFKIQLCTRVITSEEQLL
jgi:hypothetical protein